MMAKTNLFLLLICLSNMTVYGMDKTTPAIKDLLKKNNSKTVKPTSVEKISASSYHRTIHIHRSKEREKAIELKKNRAKKIDQHLTTD